MSASDRLVMRATLWQWVARCFWYPGPELTADLGSHTVRADLDEVARPCSPAVATALRCLWQAVPDSDADGQRLAEEYTFLFARQVKVHLHGTAYTVPRGTDRAPAVAEIGAFYAAFGYQVSEGLPELPDHLSVESAFLATLLAKEAYAREQGWDGRARLVRRARARFVHEHLRPALSGLAERLAEYHRLPFYPAVAGLALDILALEPAIDRSLRRELVGVETT